MKKAFFATVLMIGLVGGLLAACSVPDSPAGQPELGYLVELTNEDGEHVSIRCGVRNEGDGRFAATDELGARGEVIDQDGVLRLAFSISALDSLDAGETVFPLEISASLDPGRYELRWGQLDEKMVTTSLEVVARNGQLVLVADSDLINPHTAFTE